MRNPFVFKEIVSGEAFFNRKAELVALERHILNRQNIVIMAPRRYGKTSLIEKKLKELSRDHVIVGLDLFKISHFGEMIDQLGTQVIRQQGAPISKISGLLARGLPTLHPKITLSHSGEPEFSFDVTSPAKGIEQLDKLLNWFDQSSRKPKVIFLDEFQELTNWSNHIQIEKGLRAIIQRLKTISFIFSGSSPTLILDMFNKKGRAFYQSTIKMEIALTPPTEAREFLQHKFKLLPYENKEGLVHLIVDITKGHPFYTQLAGYFAWETIQADETLSLNEVKDSVLRSIFRQEKSTFEALVLPLSQLQRQTFRAIAIDANVPVLGKDFLSRHKLGAASSVQKTTAYLLKQGLVLKTDQGFMVSDPLLALWYSMPNF